MDEHVAQQSLPQDASLSAEWPAAGEPLIALTSSGSGAFDDNVAIFDEIKKLDKTTAEFIEHSEDHRTSTLTKKHYSQTPDFPTTILSVRRPDHIVLGVVGDTPLTEAQMKMISLMQKLKGRTTLIIRGATQQEVIDKMIAERALPDIKDESINTLTDRYIASSIDHINRRNDRRVQLVDGGLSSSFSRSMAVAAALAVAGQRVEALAQEPIDLVQHSYDRRRAKGLPLPAHQQIRHKRGKGKLKRW